MSEEGALPATIPYSTDPAHLLYPGRAPDFFAPRYGRAPSDVALCAEMARLAYLRHEDPGETGRLEAILRDRAQFELDARFDAAGTQGFTASGPAPDGGRVTVVAFRGTEPMEARDLRQDARFWPARWGADAQVHTGFAEALGAVRDQVECAIRDAPGRLLLTGHSLGAAIATLAASLVPGDRRAQTLLCTFGSPRVGDQQFGESLAGVTHFRYAGACDLVSWVPPVGPLVPYRHHGIFRCIDRTGRIHELGAGEAGDEQAAPVRAATACTQEPLAEIFLKLLARQVPAYELSDHAPINYMSAVWGLRP